MGSTRQLCHIKHRSPWHEMYCRKGEWQKYLREKDLENKTLRERIGWDGEHYKRRQLSKEERWRWRSETDGESDGQSCGSSGSVRDCLGQKWGGERGEPEREREVRVRWRYMSESHSQTNVCLSVPLGRHVSALPDWAPPCSHCGSLPWPIITPLQEDTCCIITMCTGKHTAWLPCKPERGCKELYLPINLKIITTIKSQKY